MDRFTDLNHYRARLERGHWFSALPKRYQDRLLAHASVVNFAAGERLFSRGDPNSGLFAILKGAVRISAVKGDREAVVGVAGPSMWLGEISFFDGQPRGHHAAADVPTTVLHIPTEALHGMLVDDPLLWRYLAMLMVEKMRAVFVALEDRLLAPAPVRVAKQLASIMDGYGVSRPVAARDVRIGQEQLAKALSLTRQTVGEALKDLEARGVIRRGHGRVEVLNVDALRAAADQPS